MGVVDRRSNTWHGQRKSAGRPRKGGAAGEDTAKAELDATIQAIMAHRSIPEHAAGTANNGHNDLQQHALKFGVTDLVDFFEDEENANVQHLHQHQHQHGVSGEVTGRDSRCIFYESTTSEIHSFILEQLATLDSPRGRQHIAHLCRSVAVLVDILNRQNTLIAQLQSNTRSLERANFSLRDGSAMKKEIDMMSHSSLQSSHENLQVFSSSLRKEMRTLQRGFASLLDECHGVVAANSHLSEVMRSILNTCESVTVRAEGAATLESEKEPLMTSRSPSQSPRHRRRRRNKFARAVAKVLPCFFATSGEPAAEEEDSPVETRLERDIGQCRSLFQENKRSLGEMSKLLKACMDSFGDHSHSTFSAMHAHLEHLEGQVEKGERTQVVVNKLLETMADLSGDIQQHAEVKSQLIDELDECNLKLMASENKGCQVALECLMLQTA